jgi:hypothetical protein
VKVIGNLKALTLLFSIVLIAGVALCLLIFREPANEGRRLSEWVADLGSGRTPQQVAKAQKAVRTIGTNALPFLIKALRTRDSALKRTLIELSRKQSLMAESPRVK